MDEQRETPAPERDLLAEYRRKRASGATPEPVALGVAAPEATPAAGEPGSVGRPGRFVVQQHAARRLHWDLRLEFAGVLHSWAVPKGPSLDPAEKRLAVETEPHPLEYVDFEGKIPPGNYGAGAMIVWDRGAWVPHLDPVEGMETGKQLFELKGHKLRGLWTLVKTHKAKKGESKEWLLIKKPDGAASGEDATDLPAGSVLSGLSVDELAAGEDRAAELAAELAAAGVPRTAPRLADARPMLAEVADGPFSRPGWLFEIKYDGYRLLAASGEAAAEGGERGGRVRLAYRSGRDATAVFPEIARALAAQPYGSLLLDGELVVLDDEARPVFQRLQQRAMLSRRPDVERAAVELPAVYYVFDLLAVEGYDLRGLPLSRRKQILARVLPAAGPLRYADHVEERGEELYAAARQRGLEGLVAKRADAPYRAGRGPDWLKVRAAATGDFVVVGYTPPKGRKKGVGALHLAVVDGARLVYAGKVGSGFTADDLRGFEERFAASGRAEPPLAEPRAGEPPLPRGAGHHWVEPSLVVEVRYTEVTPAGQLRHPVFLRPRPDKPPGECVPPAGIGGGAAHEEEPPEVAMEATPAAAPRSRLRLSNLEKVFWPDEGYTKGDLLAWYQAAAPYLLPYLADRPVVLDRYPDGVAGKSFFQKKAPEATPDWVRTEPVWSDDGGEAARYFVCDDVETLLYLANLGSIPLHVWASRVAALQHPDWCILDLDAKQAPFSAAVEVARAVQALADGIGWPAHAKTSGATGLHVLLPLGGKATHEQARQLAELLARVVATELPELASVARMPASRQGKVYVDYLQNGYGKLLVAPYSVRPLPGAPVSMPLAWEELQAAGKNGLDPADFTIRTAVERLEGWAGDPLRGVLDEEVDLVSVLGRLMARVS